MAFRVSKRRSLWLFVLPSLITSAVLFGIPVAMVLWLSLTDAALQGQPAHFVGLANYLALAGDDRLLGACRNTVLIAVSGAIMQTGLGRALALALDALRRGAQTLLALIMLPNIITPVAGALFLKWIFITRWGLADAVLIPMGIDPPDWLGDPSWARGIVVFGDTWRAMPFAALVIYTALQMLDRALSDAARVDGATGWQVLRHVVLPGLRPVLLVIFGLRLMYAIRLFDLVYMLTDGGPGSATETMSLYAYTLAMRRLQLGQAAAVGVIAALLAVAPFLAALTARRR
jgi:multiple sugar transport system permease protein